jgi:CRP-like cAMP-binding protein
MSTDAKIDRIRSVPMFAHAAEHALELLASAADEVHVKPGHALVTQDHSSHEAYVIEEGTAEVVVDGEIVAEIPAGELIGELAFLDPGPASATVRAKTDLEILVIPHNRLDAIVEESPAMLRAMAKELAARLRAMDERHREDARQIVSLSVEAVQRVQAPMLYSRPRRD